MVETKLKEEKKEEQPAKEVKETLKTLLGEIDALKKDRDILMQSADKRALARYYSRHKGDLPPIVSLRSIDGKLIIGWRMKEDKGSYQIPGTGRWTEHQIVEVIYQDGSKEEMAEMEFERKYEKHIQAKQIGTITDDRTGEIGLKLQRLDNGENLEMNVKFVN